MYKSTSASLDARSHLCAVGKILGAVVAVVVSAWLVWNVPGTGGIAGFVAVMLALRGRSDTTGERTRLLVMNLLVNVAAGVALYVLAQPDPAAVSDPARGHGLTFALNIVCAVSGAGIFCLVQVVYDSLKAMYVHYRGWGVAWMAGSAVLALSGIPYGDIVSFLALMVLLAVPRRGIHPLSVVVGCIVHEPLSHDPDSHLVPTPLPWVAVFAVMSVACVVVSLAIAPAPVMPVRIPMDVLLFHCMIVLAGIAWKSVQGMAWICRSVQAGCRQARA